MQAHRDFREAASGDAASLVNMLQTFLLAEIVLFGVFAMILALGMWSSYASATTPTPRWDDGGGG